MSNGFVWSKLYDKRDDFNFDVFNVPSLDGDIPRAPSYGVYISQLIRFARVSSHLADFNAYYTTQTAKFLKQGYRNDKRRKVFFLSFNRRHTTYWSVSRLIGVSWWFFFAAVF